MLKIVTLTTCKAGSQAPDCGAPAAAQRYHSTILAEVGRLSFMDACALAIAQTLSCNLVGNYVSK